MNTKETMVDEAEKCLIDHPLYTMTQSSFSIKIEECVQKNQIDYLDAVCFLCQEYDIDFQAVPKLLTPTMKDKIELAAINRNYRI